MTNPDANQPDRHPLASIARTVGTVRAAVLAVLSVPAVLAIVGANLPGHLDAVLGAVVVLLNVVGPMWSAVAVRVRGEKVVTPVADPRGNGGVPLVPATTFPDGTTAR
jgi:hypothetical protein